MLGGSGGVSKTHMKMMVQSLAADVVGEPSTLLLWVREQPTLGMLLTDYASGDETEMSRTGMKTEIVNEIKKESSRAGGGGGDQEDEVESSKQE
jgi:hypothetical protein